MATPLTGKSQNSPGKMKQATYGVIRMSAGSGGKATPLTGTGQNAPRGKYPKNPTFKKINIPLPVRQDDGQLRMGNG